jgi:predicted GIY-YIG superfamily endonuclease
MVYLIHFEKPYKHARHYIGFTDNLDQRIHEHKYTANGAKLLQVVRNAGINFEVARVWPDGDRHFERHLKNMKKSSCYCPVCRKERREQRGA